MNVADATATEGGTVGFTVTLSAAGASQGDGRLCHGRRDGDERRRLHGGVNRLPLYRVCVVEVTGEDYGLRVVNEYRRGITN